MFITSVVDTGDKLFSGVNDTGKKLIAGVVDTGCGTPGTFRYFELCSICLREGLGHSKPSTNP